MYRLAFVFVLMLAAASSGCAPELNLSPAPDIEPELEAFRNPDAEVVPSIMTAVASRISDVHAELEASSFYLEILDLIAQVQDELYNDEGQVDLGGGLTFNSPNGGVTVDYICEGWDDPPPNEPDPANGSMQLDMRLAAGHIAPLVWGTLDDCRYPLQVGELRLDALYRGDIAIYFSEPLTAENDPYSLEVIFVAEGSIEVENRVFPIDELFSVTLVEDDGEFRLDRLDILVELPDGTAFVYAFFENFDQQITDSTGTFRCSLEERFCDSPSGTFSW